MKSSEIDLSMSLTSSKKEMHTELDRDHSIRDVIVIGAGMSGLTAASELKASGFDVCVFEKARGTGGRLGSKRVKVDVPASSIDDADLNAGFDLGASVFQAKTTEFKRYLQELMLQGVVSNAYSSASNQMSSRAGISPDEDSYVAVPRNSMLTRHLSRELDITFSKKISRIEFKDANWYVFAMSQGNTRQPQTTNDMTERAADTEELIACCRHLILSAPAEQAHLLLPKDHAASSWVRNIHSDPAFVSTVMLKANAISSDGLHAINRISNAVIESVSIEHQKSDRKHGGYQIIKLTATTSWSMQNLDEDPTAIEQLLKQQLIQILLTLSLDEINILKQYTHRWLYSQYSELIKSTKGYLSFSDNLHIVGDYFDVSNELPDANNESDPLRIKGVERSYISAQRLVTHLLNSDSVNTAQSLSVNVDNE
jgi:predicted NAD/FAD-dependent oxidoreductase